MSEDFHVIWDASTRWEDDVHYLMAPQDDRINALMPMLHFLIESPIDLSGKNVCPIRRDPLEVEIYCMNLTQNPLTISMFCKTCNIHDFFRSNKIPSWAKKWPDDFPEMKEFFSKLGDHGENNA